jgi:hypothetical protein
MFYESLRPLDELVTLFMPLHIHLPSHTKLDKCVAEVFLDGHTELKTEKFTILRHKKNDTHQAVIDEIVEYRVSIQRVLVIMILIIHR